MQSMESMESKSIKIISNNKDYEVYLEKLRKYYELKNKYNKRVRVIKNKILNSDNTIEVKKQLYAKNKFKCINCNNEGGTIFTENSEILKAVCGNTSSPCKLNLEIKKMNVNKLNDDIIKLNNLIKSTKENIVLTKLDYLFKYLEEDKAIEDFENYKKNLSIYQEKYNIVLTLYNSIVDNSEKKSNIDILLFEKNDLINKFKDYIELFKKSKELRYLKEANEIYLNKLKDNVKSIREEIYSYNDVENIVINDEDIKKLCQLKYKIEDFEFIDKND